MKLRGEVEELKRAKAVRAAAVAQQREQRELKASLVNGNGTRTSPTRTFCCFSSSRTV